MTFTAALLLLAQAAASTAGAAASETPAAGRASPGGAIATATASARILKPASVRVIRLNGRIEIVANTEQKPQAERDTAGTLWIEFS